MKCALHLGGVLAGEYMSISGNVPCRVFSRLSCHDAPETNSPLTVFAKVLFAAGWWNNGKVQNDGVAPEVFEASCSSPGSNVRGRFSR